MVPQKGTLLIGNIKEDGSRSMHVYLENILNRIKNADHITPTTKIKTVLYKLIAYPLIIPRGYGAYHILDHSYGNLALSLPKKRTIITCHDLIPLIFPQRLSLFGRMTFKLYLSGLKRASIIISDSENTKKDLIKIVGIDPKKIIVIPLGLNRVHFKRIKKIYARKRFNFGEDDKIILSVGGFFYKNTLLTLKAIKELSFTDNKIRLIKVGSFTKDEEKFISQNNIGQLIYRKNNLTHEEMNNIYCASDILSFPSIYEGFGWPPLEAMACGTPVISSNVSSLPEVVGDAAIQINPNSVKELTVAIKSIMSDKKLRNHLIKNGIKNIRRFSWDKYARRLNRLYSEVIQCAE